jgi:hypothetical protein
MENRFGREGWSIDRWLDEFSKASRPERLEMFLEFVDDAVEVFGAEEIKEMFEDEVKKMKPH